VVPRFRSDLIPVSGPAWLCLGLLLWCAVSIVPGAQADAGRVAEVQTGRLAMVTPGDFNALAAALELADRFFLDQASGVVPGAVVMVLHGSEVAAFLRRNYRQYRSVIDLSARLSALGVVDIRICETRLRALGEDASALLPFVTTVPYGPAEIDRLLTQEKFSVF
jgi:intracellular sulfur oxidation DsrE/DsrF family protein